jgi:fructose/tagatose bisphosphate aldolase
MMILNRPDEIRPLLKKYAERQIALPCFCAENTFTMEGILFGAQNAAERSMLDEVVVYIAATGNYHGRQQLKNYTSLNSTEEGFYAFRSDLERLARNDGPFADIKVIPSLDHGQPGLDDELFQKGKDFWGCVMYDCSTMSLDKNRMMTGEFVRRWRDQFVIEGCVDEITEAGDGGMKLTVPADARKFLDETGVDLVVVNLGTEHRATAAQLRYRSDIAKDIYNLTGQKLVLHGTSSLSKDDLKSLRHDGIAKVNIWTVLETKTSQDMIVSLLRQIGDILPADRIEELIKDDWLGENVVKANRKYKPTLTYLTEVYRRTELKVPSVARMVSEFIGVLSGTDL